MAASPILLVDDNDAVAGALVTVLDLLGYRVTRARSAEEGWAFFIESGACLLLTDNVMDGDAMTDMSGLDLAKRVRSASPATPIVMLSAIPPQDAPSVCDIVLAKPIRIRDLEGALQRLGVHPELSHSCPAP